MKKINDTEKNIYTTADGTEVEVNTEIAEFLEENDSYMKKLMKIDERHFNIVHFDKDAWENMDELATEFSAEDEALDIPEEVISTEKRHYSAKLKSCREVLRDVQSACTKIQWRRFYLHNVEKLSVHEIAEIEQVSVNSVKDSIRVAKNIFSHHSANN